MPVHDMGLSAVQPELHQNLIDHILAVQQLIITVFCFLMSLFFLHKVPLKSRHFILAEHRRVRPFPDVPYHILPFLHFCRIIFGIIALSGILIQNIVQCLSSVFFPVHGKRIKVAVFIHRHASVVQQVRIINFIKPSPGKKKTDMLL